MGQDDFTRLEIDGRRGEVGGRAASGGGGGGEKRKGNFILIRATAFQQLSLPVCASAFKKPGLIWVEPFRAETAVLAGCVGLVWSAGILQILSPHPVLHGVAGWWWWWWGRGPKGGRSSEAESWRGVGPNEQECWVAEWQLSPSAWVSSHICLVAAHNFVLMFKFHFYDRHSLALVAERYHVCSRSSEPFFSPGGKLDVSSETVSVIALQTCGHFFNLKGGFKKSSSKNFPHHQLWLTFDINTVTFHYNAITLPFRSIKSLYLKSQC